MCKVYLYSRVSTSQQTLAQQERTAYEWLKAHNMKVDEVVSDEGISGGVNYADRNLGKVLLPKMVEGDVLIVSEISRLGRSMFNLSELIHKELKPRKIRLVCVNMGIDLNCSKMTAIDELIISNFSFAAELEKQLISERTLSALQVKKKQGVKLGGAASKWQETRNAKTYKERQEEADKSGSTQNSRHIQGRDFAIWVKVFQKAFPETCSMDVFTWDTHTWKSITTRGDNKFKIIEVMKDIQDLDQTGEMFKTWDFNAPTKKLQMRIGGAIAALHNSVKRAQRYGNETTNNK